MSFYSYKIEHDYGLAPNPFGGYCTLAVCKSSIRNNNKLDIGDWIFGTGSMALKNLHQLIYAMCVEEKITYNEYWREPRFQYKKPKINGSLVQIYGDNIYHKDTISKKWIQENSAHSLEDGSTNKQHLSRDVRGKFVLISRDFFYFGHNSPDIPKKFLSVCCEGRDMKSTSIPPEVAKDLILWLRKEHKTGIHGDPISWKHHK